MRSGFLLDPEVAYFNHGSYGACPAEVFDEYQRRQRELDAEPTELLTRRFEGAMWEARVALATFVGNRLYADHGVEVPVYEWEDTTLMRISIGPYNDEPDLERLVDAVRQLASARH